MNKPSRVRMSGPLVAHRRGFTAELKRQGYSPFTAVSVLYLAAHLSRWLERQGLDAGDLTAECVERYLAARRASGQVRRLTPRGLRPLLSYLRGLGVAPRPAAPTAATARSQLLDAFTDYLRVQRGLAPLTVVGYRRYVRTFLFERPEEESLEPRRLKSAALSVFMLDQSERRSVGWLNNMATALSALMRFLYVRGDIEPSLVDAVPRAAQRYLAPPKPVLHAADVSRLLGSCDRRRAAGRRDYALLTLLVRLGLRAAEAAALRVDDVHWRVGEIVVSGKGGTRERLPLKPQDIDRLLGDALSPEEVGATKQRLVRMQRHVRTLQAEGQVIRPDAWDRGTGRGILRMSVEDYNDASTSYFVRDGLVAKHRAGARPDP